ncbi:MAG: TnsA endonuclease N-terminal domain-containing protein [Verrucomicrobia bacterium]|nr:TnsA endonuclease N-terminal domain-containing protein [Verrucomicrobiota bacterium]
MPSRKSKVNAGYVPAITTPGFSSTGKRTRVFGRKSGRIHHLLSGLETHYFFCLDHCPLVTNIREQFPLEVSSTVDCAKRLDFKHPIDPKTRIEREMTTDFLVDLRDVNNLTRPIARSTKYLAEWCITRNQELVSIEHLYWSDRESDFGVVTERCIPHAVVQNAEWLRVGTFDLPQAPVEDEVLNRIEEVLRDKVQEGDVLGRWP